MAAYKLVLIRHGESCWNQENRFCGWFDADLSETGAQEAKKGGQALKGLYSITFSSVVNERCLPYQGYQHSRLFFFFFFKEYVHYV